MGGVKIMRYYKSNTGQVYAYDENQTPIAGLTLMTEAEITAHITPSAEAVKAARIAELKGLLLATDYVGLSDYDKEKPDIIAQRAAWRAEIRELEE